MNRRTIALIILIVGLLLLILVGFVFLRQQDASTPAETTPAETEGEVPADGSTPVADSGEGTESESVEPVDGGVTNEVNVIVSLQTLPRGFQYPDTLEELESLIAVDRRDSSTFRGSFITDPSELLGRFARTDIFQGETLTNDSVVTDLTEIAEQEKGEYGPSSLIPPGTIAVGVPLDRLSGVAYAVAPGDYVDILISFPFYKIDEQFQTYLENDAAFYVEEFVEAVEDLGAGEEVTAEGEEEGTSVPTIFTISPFGRFEELPTGDLAHIGPSETQRPILVSVLVQNARVIQVGPYFPPEPAALPTEVPPPPEEGEPTPTPLPAQATPTATAPPNVIVLALRPQEQLFLKYSHEVGADIDFALRRFGDGQVYDVEQVDLNYLIERFDIEVPPNIGFSVDQFPEEPPAFSITPTPEPETFDDAGGSAGGTGGNDQDLTGEDS